MQQQKGRESLFLLPVQLDSSKLASNSEPKGTLLSAAAAAGALVLFAETCWPRKAHPSAVMKMEKLRSNTLLLLLILRGRRRLADLHSFAWHVNEREGSSRHPKLLAASQPVSQSAHLLPGDHAQWLRRRLHDAP